MKHFFCFSKTICLLTVACASFCVLPNVFAQGITIRQTAKSANPTIRVEAITGHAHFSKQVKSDIKNCGWFDLVEGDKADFVLSGSATAQGLQLRLDRLKGGEGSVAVSQPNVISVPETTHRAVDLMLNKVFDIKGICSYKIAFSAVTDPLTKEIFVCDFDGSNPTQITHNQSQSIEPVWGPNNQSLLYTLYGNQSTYVAETRLNNKMSRRISQYRGMNAAPALAGNSSTYACILSKDGVVDLYLRTIGGTASQRLTSGKGVEGSPVFSPDGSQICFVSDMQKLGKPRLYLMSSRGGALKQIPTVGYDPTSPDWSLDNKLIYAAKTSKGVGLCVIDLAGGAKNGLGEIITERFESPSWAPDNRHVVAQYSNNKKSSLWVIDTWTGKSRPLFSTKVNASLPAWQKR